MSLREEGLGARIPRFWRRKVLGAGLLGLREKDAESSDSLVCKRGLGSLTMAPNTIWSSLSSLSSEVPSSDDRTMRVML